MESVDWLRDLPATHDTTVLERAARPDPALAVVRRARARRRRRQGGRIKKLLCQSPAAEVVPRLLLDMEQTLGVHLDRHSLENPGCRVVWEVTFDHEAPWIYRYFVVQRLFSGCEIDPDGTHYLGPEWEAPDAWLQYGEEELAQLTSQEHVAVHSAAGEQKVRVGDDDWVLTLQSALREAYRYPFREGGL